MLIVAIEMATAMEMATMTKVIMMQPAVVAVASAAVVVHKMLTVSGEVSCHQHPRAEATSATAVAVGPHCLKPKTLVANNFYQLGAALLKFRLISDQVSWCTEGAIQVNSALRPCLNGTSPWPT